MFKSRIVKGIAGFFSKILLSFIRFYQKFISPLSPPCCRFYPTCSQYGMESIKKFGPAKGLYLTTRRILRCNPLNPGGFDPVPEKKEKDIEYGKKH